MGLVIVFVGLALTVLGLLEPFGELLLLVGAFSAAISMESIAGLPITGEAVVPSYELAPAEHIRSAA